VAVEKDPQLAGYLARRFATTPAVTICGGDVLQAPLPTAPYKVFANIPFNATAAIVTRLTTACRPPDDTYLAVQKEAAARFMGQPRESLYAVLMKPWFEPSVVFSFRRSDFIPAPHVDIVMLRLRKRGPPLVSPSDAPLYRDFVTYAFMAWQPSLDGTLRRIFGPQQLRCIRQHLGIDLDATPTTVQFEQWLSLFHLFRDSCDAGRLRRVLGAGERLKRQQAGLQKVHRTRTRVGRPIR
jgi:23S rRNA (adenine-N6)-dimethyltransferase